MRGSEGLDIIHIDPLPAVVRPSPDGEPWRQTWLRGVALTLGCLALYLMGSAGYDLFTDDELRYAEAGRQLLETGNWIIPEYNGEPRYQKPIFFYWLQAASQALWGSTALAARLPAALAGTAVVLLVARLGRALWGPGAGWWSGLALAVSLGMVLVSRMVLTDVVLLLFVQGGITCFCLAQLQPGREKPHYRCMYACFALGVLTKGPVALLLPAAVLGPWLACRGELLRALRHARWLEGMLLMAVIAGPWYFLAHVQTGGAFTRQFLLTENVDRFTSTVNLHRQPIFFHLLLLLPLTFPWTGLLPAALWSGWRGSSRSRGFSEAAPRLLLWQIVLVLVLCTLSKTKVWTYTLPVLPPVALLIGCWLATPAAGDLKSALQVSLWLFGGVSAVLAMGTFILQPDHLPVQIRSEELLLALRGCAGLLLALAVLLLVLQRWTTPRQILAVLVAGAAAWHLAVHLLLMPRIDAVWNQPIRELAQVLEAHPRATVITYHVHELGMNYQAGVKRVHHWRKLSESDLREMLATRQPIFVLVDRHSRRVVQRYPFHVWGEGPRFLFGANFPPSAMTRGNLLRIEDRESRIEN